MSDIVVAGNILLPLRILPFAFVTQITQISIRMTSEFKAELEKQAQKERRSVANLVLKVMISYSIRLI